MIYKPKRNFKLKGRDEIEIHPKSEYVAFFEINVGTLDKKKPKGNPWIIFLMNNLKLDIKLLI